jgi:hypothetical protein
MPEIRRNSLLAGVVGANAIPRLFYRITPEEPNSLAKLPGLFGGGHLTVLSLAVVLVCSKN